MRRTKNDFSSQGFIDNRGRKKGVRNLYVPSVLGTDPTGCGEVAAGRIQSASGCIHIYLAAEGCLSSTQHKTYL